MDFAILAVHKVKLKESEKMKYQDQAGELKNLWSRKETMVTIVIGALRTILKGFVKELKT